MNVESTVADGHLKLGERSAHNAAPAGVPESSHDLIREAATLKGLGKTSGKPGGAH